MTEIKNLSIVGLSCLPDKFIPQIIKSDYIIAADGASFLLIKKGIIPDLAVGDFDSLSSVKLRMVQNKIAKIIKYPRIKDLTDMHLAVIEALKLKPQKITIYGGTGKRIDHFLGNLFLLELINKFNIKAEIVDEYNEIKIIEKIETLTKSAYFPYFSIIPLSEETVVSATGCRYEIKNKKITRGQTIGISNEIIKDQCLITVEKGKIVLIRSKDS
ncbi:thiamine diphosphokinase [Candidatus Gottesmanbacteria bacterium RBG_16_37_8]|uniref:Thiamine diphosphokinase n=1 Tax=Candidatus Gottesmanbacteria bacterium RBG_16_37_8 TaxID=1798371 RepID=A0A1F5YTZ4_9BACT|nr:MAG: thiamine diphosphokinase [Candidatus Gottesmanbacteria bacterium RBG_16_37_8]